jgi:hypothetical protein
MSKQWHPLFAHLLRLLLDRYYSVQTEVSVSDLPRRGDLLLLRRQTEEPPPFEGLWSHLTDWNVLEFKGPGDYPHEDDLELLVHVGTGLTVRFNEERRAAGQERLANRQVSLWYLAPSLGETFLEQAQGRTFFTYETGGLWRGRVWGHPVWLVSGRDLPVEVDTVPLHLLDIDPPAPAAVGALVLHDEDLQRRFATWLVALQPLLWEEMRHMAETGAPGSGIINWEAVSRVVNLDEAVRFLPAEHVIQVVGVQRAIEVVGAKRTIEIIGLPRVIEAVGLPRVIEAVGLPRVIEAVGLPRVIEAVGLPRVIETIGPDKLLQELLKVLPPEQVQEMLRRQQQDADNDKGGE